MHGRLLSKIEEVYTRWKKYFNELLKSEKIGKLQYLQYIR